MSDIVNKVSENKEDIVDEKVKEASTKFDHKKVINLVLQIAEIATGYKYHTYERPFAYRIIESIMLNEGEEITAIFPRQSGKSHTVAMTCVGLLIVMPRLAQAYPKQLGEFKKGIWIGVYAPGGEQARTIYDRIYTMMSSKEAEAVMRDPDIGEDWDKSGGYIMTGSGSFVYSQSAAPRSNIESKTYHLLINDESQDMNERVVLKSLHPMVASKNGTITKIGSCSDHKCEFLDVIKRNEREASSGKKKTHFTVTWRQVAKENPAYGKFIKKEVTRYGEESDYFRMNYGGEWVLESGMFVTERVFNNAVSKSIKIKTQEDAPCVAGLDLGKKRDSMVLTIIKPLWNDPDKEGFFHKIVLNWLELKKVDYNQQFYRVVDFLKDYDIRALAIDSTGAGEPVYDRFKEYFGYSITVVPFVFSLQSKSEMYKLLDAEFSTGRIIIPGEYYSTQTKKHQKFRQQVLDLEKGYKGPYMQVSHPDTRDAHDDYPDSLALANWVCQRHELPVISEMDRDVFVGGRNTGNHLFSGN